VAPPGYAESGPWPCMLLSLKSTIHTPSVHVPVVLCAFTNRPSSEAGVVSEKSYVHGWDGPATSMTPEIGSVFESDSVARSGAPAENVTVPTHLDGSAGATASVVGSAVSGGVEKIEDDGKLGSVNDGKLGMMVFARNRNPASV
jgi:hypothetical protein